LPENSNLTVKEITVYDIIESLADKLNYNYETKTQILKLKSKSLQNLQLDNKSLLHQVTQLLDIGKLEVCLQDGYDPWVRNKDDEMLPIHISIQNGDYAKTKLLLDAMKLKTEKFNLENLNLLQKVVANHIPIERRGEHLDHNECLKILLEEKRFVRGLNTVKRTNQRNDLLDLVLQHFDKECKRIVEEKVKVRFRETALGKFETLFYDIH